VSTVPTLHGESIALRILDSYSGRMTLEDLGLMPDDLARLVEVTDRPNGMVLTTGPGGSGKSTTLHAAVRRLSTGREKIFTVEDPVEFGMDGVCQVSVNHKAGLTFAQTLRSLVRQDPDVLLVGEIRDRETAEIATHAALTGHLVLSTLHTIDAVSALHRLVDIGVQDYLVVHTLEGVMAQRLVRRVCENCAVEQPVAEEFIAALGPVANDLVNAMEGEGCERCRGTGYKGRIGLYELMRVTEPLRQAFLQRADKSELEDIARAAGMKTLREDGIRKIKNGITTPDEVIRATKSL
jgi:type II secretory ATPase GspE/PulE/Tfp pilus assembly ATPase PilB-like protein